MKRYDFAFCTDEGYLKVTLACIWNLINKKTEMSIYHIHLIVTSDFDVIFPERLKNAPNVVIHIIRFSADELSRFSGIRHVSNATYLKFFIPSLVEAERVLYLDGDVYINQCVECLWDIVPDDVCLAAVWDPGYDMENDLIGLKCGEKSFNAGILFFNNDKMRKEKITEKLVDFYAKNYDSIQNADQTVFNAVLKNNWYELNAIYNLQRIHYLKEASLLGMKKRDKLTNIRNPIMVHFTTHSKPWMFRCAHPFKKEYMKNYRSLFGKSEEKDRGIDGMIKKIYESIQYTFLSRR